MVIVDVICGNNEWICFVLIGDNDNWKLEVFIILLNYWIIG